jgi:hypothetical protein
LLHPCRNLPIHLEFIPANRADSIITVSALLVTEACLLLETLCAIHGFGVTDNDSLSTGNVELEAVFETKV